jgi:hypothetical protein
VGAPGGRGPTWSVGAGATSSGLCRFPDNGFACGSRLGCSHPGVGETTVLNMINSAWTQRGSSWTYSRASNGSPAVTRRCAGQMEERNCQYGVALSPARSGP